jgi:hypothetical protein
LSADTNAAILATGIRELISMLTHPQRMTSSAEALDDELSVSSRFDGSNSGVILVNVPVCCSVHMVSVAFSKHLFSQR